MIHVKWESGSENGDCSAETLQLLGNTFFSKKNWWLIVPALLLVSFVTWAGHFTSLVSN